MRWLTMFRNRRRRAAARSGASAHRPGGWGLVALPPPPAGTQSVTHEPQRPKVGLGFADGTSVEIDGRSGYSDALRHAASTLMGDRPG
jgi:hypothetical protein